jgi:hypothetical protein
MRTIAIEPVPVALVLAVLLSLPGCSGLAQRHRATRDGISIEYTVRAERLVAPKHRVAVSAIDERLDRGIIGDGAKPNWGTHAMGLIAFGVVYAAMAAEPSVNCTQGPTEMFKTALENRLSKNGVAVANDLDGAQTDTVRIALLVRQLKIDFNFGTWSGEVGYFARITDSGKVICEDEIYEHATAFNWYGFGSGERAISEAFTKAIDRLDINGCFAKPD